MVMVGEAHKRMAPLLGKMVITGTARAHRLTFARRDQVSVPLLDRDQTYYLGTMAADSSRGLHMASQEGSGNGKLHAMNS